MLHIFVLLWDIWNFRFFFFTEYLVKFLVLVLKLKNAIQDLPNAIYTAVSKFQKLIGPIFSLKRLQIIFYCNLLLYIKTTIYWTTSHPIQLVSHLLIEIKSSFPRHFYSFFERTWNMFQKWKKNVSYECYTSIKVNYCNFIRNIKFFRTNFSFSGSPLDVRSYIKIINLSVKLSLDIKLTMSKSLISVFYNWLIVQIYA